MRIKNIAFRALAWMPALFLYAVAGPGLTAERAVEHVMNIGSGGSEAGQFQYVEDIAFSRDGHLLATDASNGWVQAFDKETGKFLARFGGEGDEDGSLDKPEGIAVDPDGNIFIADYITGFIKKYSPNFDWQLTFGGYGTEKGQTKRAEYMDIKGSRIYLADGGNDRVIVFDLSGKFLFDFGKSGSGLGELNDPEAARFGSDGNLYVTDLKNDRVQVFDPDGKFIRSFGHSGSGRGELKSPAGIAFDAEGNVYVTEVGNDRVQVFDRDGQFLTMWGRKGNGDGEFGNLHGIAIDKKTGLIYVADTANNRIQVFRWPKPASQ